MACHACGEETITGRLKISPSVPEEALLPVGRTCSRWAFCLFASAEIVTCGGTAGPAYVHMRPRAPVPAGVAPTTDLCRYSTGSFLPAYVDPLRSVRLQRLPSLAT